MYLLSAGVKSKRMGRKPQHTTTNSCNLNYTKIRWFCGWGGAGEQRRKTSEKGGKIERDAIGFRRYPFGTFDLLPLGKPKAPPRRKATISDSPMSPGFQSFRQWIKTPEDHYFLIAAGSIMNNVQIKLQWVRNSKTFYSSCLDQIWILINYSKCTANIPYN